MAVENVSGKFIRADSCSNERARALYRFENRKGITAAGESDGSKIGSKIFDGVDRDCARARALAGKRISCHKQRRLAHVREYLLPLIQPPVDERLSITARYNGTSFRGGAMMLPSP